MEKQKSIKKKQRKNIEVRIEIPEGVKLELDKSNLIAKGKEMTIKRKINPLIELKIEGNEITLSTKNNTKRGKKVIGTFKAHIKNMVNGFKEPYKYILKICSGHFPMNVSVIKNQFVVKNFLGEKTPRTLKLSEGVQVKVEADLVIVECPDKDLAGKTASEIEKLCKITNRDPRVFQDGIWISEKAGKVIK